MKNETESENESKLLYRLADAVSARISKIPLSVDLWSSAEIGFYLKLSPRVITERYAPLPDFPKAIRLPSSSGGHGHPRWRARDIIAWAGKYQDVGTTRLGGRCRKSG